VGVMAILRTLVLILSVASVACSSQNADDRVFDTSACSIYAQLMTQIDGQLSEYDDTSPMVFSTRTIDAPSPTFPDWNSWIFTDQRGPTNEFNLEQREFTALNTAEMNQCDFSHNTNWGPIVSNDEIEGWVRFPADHQALSTELVGEITFSQVFTDEREFAVLSTSIDLHYIHPGWHDYIPGSFCHLFQKYEQDGWRLIASAPCFR
jgi:hypothetical protein